jgi:TonB family protein
VATLGGQILDFAKPPSKKGQPGSYESMAVDAKGVKHTSSDDPDGLASWMEDIVKRVQPEGPRNTPTQFDGEGSGVYRVTIDLRTGAVIDVITVKSTGYPRLDNNARVALRQWRWRPGKWRVVDIPIDFGGWSSRLPENPFPTALPDVPRGIVP